MGEEAEEQPRPSPESAADGVGEATSDGVNSWPVVHYDVAPYRTYHFFQQFRTTSSNPNNFLKGVKWSPDGSCFLTCSDENTLRVFSLPYESDGSSINDPQSVPDSDSYGASLVVSEGESVYDYCWYPHMSSSNPDLCVFATSTRDHPIHLWDANNGQLRCTYRAYDAMDEITAAFSIGFNPNGNKIFAGYNKTIRVFEVHRPGRDFQQYSTLLGNKEGQSGIISSIAFSPTCSGMLAAGSYSQTTAIYREDNMELLYVLHGQEGGVTQVQFSKDGNYLYTGGRKDPYVLCWDIRKTVDIVYKLYRSSEGTNQRVQFDIEPLGRSWNWWSGQWISSFRAALDTINGLAFHPFLPMAATSSGHRRYGGLDDSEENNTLSVTIPVPPLRSDIIDSTVPKGD
ncbi:UNVERIFIED_CONTAM: Telomerase Cajal body protein 1 [Sesamum calycinum]|uniref:Telomerase Cajal body protein 1 n=1 Tax=Sesamum calycinum TaxID=2727403 RepID=A0AAW2LT86_9LAMI